MKRWIPVLVVLLAACGRDEPPPPEPQPQGRVETQAIRNTEAVGYSGNAIADKVDSALDKNEEAARKAREAADQADSP